MKAVALWFACAAVANAQLTLSVVEHDGERAVADVVALADTPTSVLRDVVFRLRNGGPLAVDVQNLEVKGDAFSLVDGPDLPTRVNSGAALDFTVRFQPQLAGIYSAALISDGVQVLLRGNANPAVSVAFEGEQALPLVFTCQRFLSTSRRVTIANHSGQDLKAIGVEVQGDYFRLVGGPAAVDLRHGDSTSFDVLFEPRTAGSSAGALTIGTRGSFALAGTALETPVPDVDLSVSGTNVVVRLRQRISRDVSGTLRMQWLGALDSAVRFTGNSAFTISAGDTVTTIPFQLGSTAGRILFTAQLEDKTALASLEIAPAAVTIQSVDVQRSGSSITVKVTGYDNVRSIGEVAYTFYDSTGGVVSPGRQVVDETQVFRNFFANADGGWFVLTAAFPVSGDNSKITGVAIEIANNTATAKTGTIRF